MSDTFINDGKRLIYPNATGSAIAVSDVVVMDSRFCGIAVAAIANGSSGAVDVEGRHALAAKAADTWNQGAKVYWDDTNNYLTDTAGANPYAGTAAQAKTATEDNDDIEILLNVYVPDPASS